MGVEGIGARMLRKEDQRFITGKGRYTDDFNRPGQSVAVFVRSPHAHAKITGVDTAAARKLPGVHAVFTGEDVAADKLGGMPCGFTPGGGTQHAPPRPAMMADRVRFVGDLVAVVIAENERFAKDAAAKVVVSYEELPANSDPAKAMKGAPLLHEETPNNHCVDWQLGDADATAKAFESAAHVVSFNLINNRKAPNAIEPRAANAEFEPASESYTLYTTSQNPHITRLLLAAYVLGIPESKVRVISPDVGGGFGSKIPFYPEEAIITWASRKIGRPVKWTATRSEAFQSDTHGRDHVTHAELALDKDGKILGLKVNTIANLGAYLSTFGALSATYLYATLLSGQYDIPAIYCKLAGVLTNTCPIDAERGAGRPEATFVVERIMDIAARQLGIDKIELRRRNFIRNFPYQTAVVLQYDIGDYEKSLDAALKAADIDGYERRKQESARNGKLRGLGISTYIEACGLAPSNVAGAIGAGVGLYESAEVRFNPTGTVSVFTGSQTQGQGHETTFAQIVASKLGIPEENIDVIHGDTGTVQWGHGTYGSRSLAVGGSAISKACDKVIEKATKVAAHLMEADAADVEFKDGEFAISGTDKKKTIGEVILAAMVPHNFPLSEMEPGLDQRSFYDPINFTFPAGAHVCEVEIDRDTGMTQVVRFTAIDDFGNVVNPMIVEGQVHGGITHGIGQALLEQVIYDESGQLVNGSFMDYALPHASDLPSYEVGYTNTPCTHNPLGVKGCGEAGAIAAPAAVINAVADALDIDHIDMPATSEKVWLSIRQNT
jgi:aerobic carbon-monoxide dehydrogenase large subunit